MRSCRHPAPPRPLLLLLVLVGIFVAGADANGELEIPNATAGNVTGKEDSFADMIDGTLEKEFPESESNDEGLGDWSGFMEIFQEFVPAYQQFKLQEKGAFNFMHVSGHA